MSRKIFWMPALLALTACSLVAPKYEEKQAEQIAIAFFEHLAAGRYAEADAIYAGDYLTLVSNNPQISLDDHAALWKSGCKINGMQCLPIYRILTSEKFSLNEFWLTVEFKDKTGGVFTRGPCCGATAEEMPPVSRFDVYVIERDGRYYVTSLPVFTP